MYGHKTQLSLSFSTFSVPDPNVVIITSSLKLWTDQSASGTSEYMANWMDALE